jgi:hypothetical protein
MTRRGRPRGPKSAKVSGNIPEWKRNLLELLQIPPTYAISQGIDLVLDNQIANGRIAPEMIDLYIQGKESEKAAIIREIDEKIAAARQLKDRKEIQQSASQLRVWDRTTEEMRIIRSSEYDERIHQLKEEIRT